MYGDAAKKENDFAFHYLPKIDRKFSFVEQWDNMYRGKVKGLLAFGMNGVAIGPNSQKNIDALKKADWLVVGEIYPDETSSFWESPGITDDDKKKIQTKSIGCHAPALPRKTGPSLTPRAGCNGNGPPCRLQAKPSWTRKSWHGYSLGVRDLYQKEGGKFPDAILNASWAYTNPNNPSLTEVAKEINGKALADLHDDKTDADGLEGWPATARLCLAQG